MNKTDIEAVYGLSPIQQGILFHCLQEPESGLYVLQYVFRLSGELDLENFRRAWQTVCDRHSIIRTAFTWKRLTRMHQVVLRKVALPVEVIDWRQYSAGECETKLQEYLFTDQHKEFDFSSAPLLRLVLFRRADDSYQFVCSFHHLILDGWSYALMLREVTGYYQSFLTGTEFKPPKLVPYRDYIEWLKTKNSEDAKSFWTETLKGIAEPTPFPLEPTSALPEKRQHSIHLSREKTAALQKFAQTHHLTLNTIIQGAWALLLSLYTGSNDVMFGATVSGRSPEIGDVENMIGLFISSLPVRMKIDNAARVVEWLKEQQDMQARSREYDYASLVDIHSWSEIPRSLPLFETLVGFQNFPAEMSTAGSPATANGNSAHLHTQLLNSTFKNSYPLTLTVHAQNDLTLQLDYDTSRCDHDSVEKLLARLQTIVERLAANPEGRLGDVRQLDQDEQHHLVVELNQTAVDYDLDRRVHELVTEQALRTPDRIAVVYESTQLSYRELHVRSNQLVHYLLNLGVTPDMAVAICAERSPELVVAMLAVLKSGAAYLPIDPGYPAERVAYMLDEAQTPVLLTQERLREKLPATWAQVVCVDDDWDQIEKQSKDDVQLQVNGENLAYVIYTSGSTGQPKGVMVRQQGLINHMRWMAEQFSLSSEDCILQKTPVSFDASVWEFYAALMYGGRLVLAREGGHQDAGYLVAEMLREGVTLVQVVPTMLNWLV
jgi:non-ribosomal peptide synthetase component F